MRERLVPIGRFSKATRLSVKALRHYQEVGLLEDHRRHLADELARHQRMLAFLERLLSRQEHLMPHTITLEDVADRQVAALRFATDLSSIPSHLETAFGRVAGRIASEGLAPNGAPMVVFHDVIDADTAGEVEVVIPHAGDPTSETTTPAATADDDDDPASAPVRFVTLPGGTVAATTHRGPYPELAPAYHSLTDWMAERGHEAAGPPREAYLNDPREAAPEELLTRIEWPVR